MIKPKMLIISKEYWPTSNATVTCLSNIINDLKKEYTITLVTSSDELLYPEQNDSDGINIITIGDFSNYFLKLSRQFKIPFISKLMRGITYFYSINSERNWHSIGLKIEKLIELKNYESVLSITMPFLNLDASYLIKQTWPHLKHYSIVFDLYANNPSLLKDDLKLDNKKVRLVEENMWFESLDLLLTTQEFLGSFKKDHPELENKTLVIKHPLVYDLKVHDEKVEHDAIQMVYTGNFYAQLRDFSHIKNLIVKLRESNLNILLHIYGSNELEPIEGVNFHGIVPKNEALNAIVNADILLNNGNISDTQIPSKIFEYISTGKPILSLYTLKNDLCKEILKEYPISLSVSIDELNNAELIQKTKQWILENYQKSIDFSLIKRKYIEYTPEEVNQHIIQAIKY